MPIAFISDIHANLSGLQAVLGDIRRRGIRRIYCAGDLVGHGPQPGEVLALLRWEKIPCLLGNIDRDVVWFGSRRHKLKKMRKREALENFAWTWKHLPPDGIDFLAGLPREIRFRLPAGNEVLVVHGSPRDLREYIHDDLTDSRLAEMLQGASPPAVLACGHTHQPFVKQLQHSLIINCGTAGRPANGRHEIHYAILHTQPLRAEIVTLHYNPRLTIAAAKKFRLPTHFVRLMKSAGDRNFSGNIYV
jgi:predicted phosphodiesterase